MKTKLQTVCNNINTVLNLTGKNAINTNKLNEKEMLKEVRALSYEFTAEDFKATEDRKNVFTAEDVAIFVELKIDIPVKKEKKAKEEKKPAYTRSNALVEALKTGGTKDEIVKLSDKLFLASLPADKTPKAKETLIVAEALFRYAVPALLLFGTMEYNKETKTYQHTIAINPKEGQEETKTNTEEA